MTQAYPLAWPTGWKRCTYRTGGKFQVGQGVNARKLTIRDGIKRVLAELDRMGVKGDDVIVSHNIKPHLVDGQGSKTSDPGVAVYWKQRDKPDRVLAVDRYHNVADNLAALAATLEAMRAIERHGGAVVMDRAFSGFAALPAPASEPHWSELLGCRRDASPEEIRSAWKNVARMWQARVDAGDTAATARMATINAAKDRALAERTLR